MNTITNDKILSLTANQKVLQERSASNSFETGNGINTKARQKESQDSLDLSAAGQRLHQSATAQPEKSRSLPETEEQARALVARIRQQFEQTGDSALGAHSAIRGNQLDLLLRPDPA